MAIDLTLSVNGEQKSVATEADRPLLDVLREDLGMTGTKFGCGEGECGACTVLLDGVAVRSCITTVAEAEGHAIETIEGLESNGELHPVQKAFLDQQAMQCGYCVPGHIMTAVSILRERGKTLSRDEIVAEMSQHICRCCNYLKIRAAIEQAIGGDAENRSAN